MSHYTTGEIAKLCDVSVRTVQYYDTRGILSPSELSEGGRRLYSQEDLSMMRSICHLRTIGISLRGIERILREKNAKNVIAQILEEESTELSEELEKKQAQLRALKDLKEALRKTENPTVESIGDMAHVMENKNELKKTHLSLLLIGLPISLLQIGGILLWIFKGIWWLFAAWAVLVIPFGILLTRYYFARVAYVCPECKETFKPKSKEAFWAAHTLKTRKLTCPRCKHKGYCVEIYRKAEK